MTRPLPLARLAAGAVAASFGVGLLAPCPPPAPVALVPCAHEDTITACYWDAGTRGDGRGQSFIVQPDGTVVYFGGDR